jgi:hypothetical protein
VNLVSREFFSPRSHRPAVIKLPDQSSGAIFSAKPLPLPLPESVGAAEAFGLHELGAVNKLLDRVEFILYVFHKVSIYRS